MGKYNIGEVWWTYFPFEEINVSKHRPAIIIDDNTIAILAIKVTSKEKENPFYVEIQDWESAGLSKKSWTQIDRIVKMDEWRMDRKIGDLSERDLTKFIQLVMEINKNIRHNFSLLAVMDSKGRYLQKHDDRWKCLLFPYYRTVDLNNKENIDNKASELLRMPIETTYVKQATHCKYSVSDDVYKIYDHKLYKVELEKIPDFMNSEDFIIDDQKYSWKSIKELEQNPEVMEKNEDVLAFIKSSIKAS
ncbi:MAG: type II toxin-antitoxin system PemK/MazF family toxin [Lachnospiraceae bacterium]|nr:type II toxin-antitoxin system PemK/MazF family toxin [Lachnospiraceae bacterium]MDD7664824.1 type II toxin-antitoxin system PemK/MazF family toxin [Lachnospiraceae bacterium]MDY4164701.1 type II toxin-antitoxin system PemK/MazF family toxin [Lachnospiraceae bacterium]